MMALTANTLSTKLLIALCIVMMLSSAKSWRLPGKARLSTDGQV